MAVYAPGQPAAAVSQVPAFCQGLCQPQCWLRSTGLAKRLGLCLGVQETTPSQWQNAVNKNHRLLESTHNRGLTWFAQSGELLDMAKSPGRQVGAGGLKAACGPKCKERPEEASRFSL